MLIQGPEKNGGKWSIGIVTKLIEGRDGVVRAFRVRARKSYLERAAFTQQGSPVINNEKNKRKGEECQN